MVPGCFPEKGFQFFPSFPLLPRHGTKIQRSALPRRLGRLREDGVIYMITLNEDSVIANHIECARYQQAKRLSLLLTKPSGKKRAPWLRCPFMQNTHLLLLELSIFCLDFFSYNVKPIKR